MSVRSPWLGAAAWGGLVFLAALVGSLASIQAEAFYTSLARPFWAPPPWLFGPVWTVLYAMMAVAVWLVWRQTGWRDGATALTLFVVQLVLNAAWSWLFFDLRLGLWSFVDIIVLLVALTLTIRAFAQVSLTAAGLLAPYLVWVGFAAALNFVVWRLNPGLLG